MATTRKRRPQGRKGLRVVSGNRDAGLVSRRLPAQSVLASIGELPRGTLALTDADWEAISTHLTLSRRESQIARLVLEDATEADIAARLSLSPSTVHSHVERLYRKLGIHSRHQLLVRIVNAYLFALGLKR